MLPKGYDYELCRFIEIYMPKLKTRRAAAKRFKVTGSGKKITRRKAFKNHLLNHKSSEQKRRRLSGAALVHETDEKAVRLMMPYC
jgi:large subunit ribosomal protein L35